MMMMMKEQAAVHHGKFRGAVSGTRHVTPCCRVWSCGEELSLCTWAISAFKELITQIKDSFKRTAGGRITFNIF